MKRKSEFLVIQSKGIRNNMRIRDKVYQQRQERKNTSKSSSNERTARRGENQHTHQRTRVEEHRYLRHLTREKNDAHYTPLLCFCVLGRWVQGGNWSLTEGEPWLNPSASDSVYVCMCIPSSAAYPEPLILKCANISVEMIISRLLEKYPSQSNAIHRKTESVKIMVKEKGCLVAGSVTSRQGQT